MNRTLLLLSAPLLLAMHCEEPHYGSPCPKHAVYQVDLDEQGETHTADLSIRPGHGVVAWTAELDGCAVGGAAGEVGCAELALVEPRCRGCEGPTAAELAELAPGDTLPDGTRLIARGVRIQVEEESLPFTLRLVNLDGGAPGLPVHGHIRFDYGDEVRICGAPNVELQPLSFCGDGQVEMQEACDDGNAAAGDGCFGCRLEPARCHPDGLGVVEHWRCEGAPSVCEQVRCDSVEDCPAEVATATLGVDVRFRGATDAATRVRLVSESGVDCTCAEGVPGPTCVGACNVAVPACTDVEVWVDGRDGAWSGDCEGEACVLRSVFGPQRVTATIDFDFEGEGEVMNSLSSDANAPRMQLAVDGERIALTSVQHDEGPRAFVLDQLPGGHRVELGPDDRVLPQALAFDDDALWLLLAEGQFYGSYGEPVPPARFPTVRLQRFAGGERILDRNLDAYVGPSAALAPTDDGVVVALTSSRYLDPGWGGVTGSVRALDIEGVERWRWAHDGDSWFDLQDIVAGEGGIRVAGVYQGGAAPPPQPLPRIGSRSDDAAAFQLGLDEAGPAGARIQRTLAVRGRARLAAEGAFVSLSALDRRLHLGIASAAGDRTMLLNDAGQCSAVLLENSARLAVGPEGRRVLVGYPLCDTSASTIPNVVELRLLDLDGALLRTWRLEVGEGLLRLGAIALATDGPVIAGALHGNLGPLASDAPRPFLLRLR